MRERPEITSDLAKVISEHANELAACPVSVLYRSLQSHGIINPPYLSESALRRFVSANRPLSKPPETPRKKFEKEHINELWIGDTMHGPYLEQGKRKRKTYLVGVIDDHSRMLVGTGWFFQENTLALEIVLKEAISRFGLPKMFYCDNGAVFSTQSLSLACARLGIALVHSKPYDSPSRGKVQRVWRTIQDKFVSTLKLAAIDNLQALNDLFACWLDSNYHKIFHHGIHCKPIERWLADAKLTRIRMIAKEELDLAFYQSYERKVKKDSTIQFFHYSTYPQPTLTLPSPYPHPPTRSICILAKFITVGGRGEQLAALLISDQPNGHNAPRAKMELFCRTPTPRYILFNTAYF